MKLRIGQKFIFGCGGTLVLLFTGMLSFRFTRVHTLARLGNTRAMVELGGAYASFSGDGLTRVPNWRKAEYWFERAAKNGHGGADYCLFQMWFDSPERWPLVRESLQRGASNGSLECRMELAKAYRFGLYGFEKNTMKANEWASQIPKWRP